MKPYYQDDLVTLYHGDCLEIAEWLAADVLVTDPPFGIDRAQNGMQFSNGKRVTGRTVRNAVKGDSSPETRDAALTRWGARPALVFGSWRITRPADTRQRLIWHKANSSPGVTTAPWFGTDEEIYVLGRGFTGKPESNVYVTHELRGGREGLSARTGHPTPKPIGLMEALISHCPPGIVTDPFAGSGATLLAARNLGRRAVGVELEEKYCELIAKRLAQQAFDLGEIA